MYDVISPGLSFDHYIEVLVNIYDSMFTSIIRDDNKWATKNFLCILRDSAMLYSLTPFSIDALYPPFFSFC